ncbi:hypothetical protein BCU68_13385 [Vibrio sp. 10N.286.49.B3]|uniref:DUF4426 domain-containing protein n=1 Tax=Vibrio sp. 10N.286.49.B3 TaxID=1880855 RepID=UPI000C841E49|nr:DUF4426 domain-containing protein [Vibrio sp. 10N.286.49.B3]PMH43728.1 hypothetical protein BCU68_13385 [Vibrio sp. 10N.286.49.B3]
MSKWILVTLSILLALPSWAGQFITIKDIEVHYSAFNSTFLTPTIAQEYQLTRNSHSALLNISVIDRSKLGKPATSAKLSGHAKNLIGQIKTLSFREIKEGQAIYYLAEFPISSQENLTFDIHVDAGLAGTGTLRFNQKFYIEE